MKGLDDIRQSQPTDCVWSVARRDCLTQQIRNGRQCYMRRPSITTSRPAEERAQVQDLRVIDPASSAPVGPHRGGSIGDQAWGARTGERSMGSA